MDDPLALVDYLSPPPKERPDLQSVGFQARWVPSVGHVLNNAGKVLHFAFFFVCRIVRQSPEIITNMERQSSARPEQNMASVQNGM